jgi:hypothetical protein
VHHGSSFLTSVHCNGAPRCKSNLAANPNIKGGPMNRLAQRHNNSDNRTVQTCARPLSQERIHASRSLSQENTAASRNGHGTREKACPAPQATEANQYTRLGYPYGGPLAVIAIGHRELFPRKAFGQHSRTPAASPRPPRIAPRGQTPNASFTRYCYIGGQMMVQSIHEPRKAPRIINRVSPEKNG